MKQIPLYLYLIIFFLIPHIRWISLFYSRQWVYGMPVYVGIIFCVMSPLLIKHLPRKRLFCFIAVVALLAYIFLTDFNTKYTIAGGYIMFVLIGMPVVGLGAPLLLVAMENPRFARRFLLFLAAGCLLQVGYMCVETDHPGLLLMVRPNTEGTMTEWTFVNRYGSNRAMYTLTDPMNAGAWAWFTGITLIVLAPLAKMKPWQNAAFRVVGTLSLSSIVLTLSRGPATVAFVSLIALTPCLLHTTRRRLIALVSAVGTVSIIAISIYIVFVLDRPLFDSLKDLGSVAFLRDEDGNSDRIDVWAEGAKSLTNFEWNGAGLHTISFLWERPDVDLEDTYLTIMYAAGAPGLIYSAIFVISWIVQLCRLGFRVYFAKERTPQQFLCLAWGAGWLPFTFIFPCFRTVECAFITSSILGALLFFDTLNIRGEISTASHSASRGKFAAAGSR